MKAAAIFFACAVVCMITSALVWSRAIAPGPHVMGPATLARFEEEQGSVQLVDVARLYAGRIELLDPRVTLPQWHKFERDQVVRVYEASGRCPPTPLLDSGLHQPALAKAYQWHVMTCGNALDLGAYAMLVERPLMHPSGKSYAALALAHLGTSDAGWIPAHVRDFHVLELPALDPAILSSEDRGLSTLSADTWDAFTNGDGVVLTPESLVRATHGPRGLSTLRIYPRHQWERFATQAGVALVPRTSGNCGRPAASQLCWQSLSFSERHPTARWLSVVGSGSLFALASVLLGLAYVRERRSVHRDRVHVLRTLTHELRTPATSLRLDLEPLRAAFDALPTSCQAPLLRMSDDVERLLRVLHRSARYMALFESPPTARNALVNGRAISSVDELFNELRCEWPEDVSLVARSEDGPLYSDPEWLAVAVRNLVENAARHGRPPVTVAWALDPSRLTVRVEDAGSTPLLSLRHTVASFSRTEQSSGLGLGLAIVQRIAALLGGRLSHEGTPTAFVLHVDNTTALRGRS